ncbi:hypothetical protein [Companilactobacillus kimchiensis]|uniref:Uncharacterized protein n=1 Tax=Companilactobacillus kimchiensis TaxID=993692 RepID=A0A0R2LDK3_9LACO|nr:hypothetical protein [Companilactobacillus kimchiensis]KRO00020.1 hypothetical protein IV57_GL002035 [Companilactobacillus kimchiensis]
MLKFGKKVNYRPLLISLSTALVIGALFGLNISKSLGLKIGAIMFLLMILGHYLLVLPVLFNYWDSDKTSIHYSDIKKLNHRFLAIFLPITLPIHTIDKAKIISISILGLPQHNPSLSSELIVSEEGGFIYNLILMINDPVKIRLIMTDNSHIDLDLSRDYVAHQDETIGKLNLFLNEFNPEIIHLSNATRKAINIYQY